MNGKNTYKLPEHGMTRRLDFGANVRAVRKTLGLSQEKLAEKIGCDRQTVNRAENGKFSMTLDRAYDLAEGLGVPLAQLLPEAHQELADTRCTLPHYVEGR